jgi:hypothetical protein
MRWRKLFISFFLSLTVVINAVALGFAAANEEQYDIIVVSLQLFFSLYVFLLSSRSVGQSAADEHANSILHVTGLTTVAFALFGSIVILPDRSPPVAASGVGSSEPVLVYLWYNLVGLYTILCVLTFTTPLGPPLYFPPKNIYSKKTVDLITNKDEENVCGIISA